jgi:RimJ/RimL family protein N-acetyltransferase
VGDASYFYDEQQEIWLAAISICAKYRGQGYESAALQLLCAAAREAGIPEKDIKNWDFLK